MSSYDEDRAADGAAEARAILQPEIDALQERLTAAQAEIDLLRDANRTREQERDAAQVEIERLRAATREGKCRSCGEKFVRRRPSFKALEDLETKLANLREAAERWRDELIAAGAQVRNAKVYREFLAAIEASR